jgi:hypothetical protein
MLPYSCKVEWWQLLEDIPLPLQLPAWTYMTPPLAHLLQDPAWQPPDTSTLHHSFHLVSSLLQEVLVDRPPIRNFTMALHFTKDRQCLTSFTITLQMCFLTAL